MIVLEWLGYVLLAIGGLAGLAGGIGLLKFDDFYTRLHAAGVTDTLCAISTLGGLMLLLGADRASLKLLLVVGLLLFTSSTATHALARAGKRAGLLQRWDQGGRS